jgi:hypothetical protein
MEEARRFRRRLVVALAAAAVAIAGAVVVLTRDGGHKPPPVRGTPAEAVAVVDSFRRALATRDFATICDSLFSKRARSAAGGDDCQSVLAQAAARIRRPSVQIKSVVLTRGNTAAVGVVASATGRGGAPDVIRLVRERGRFRIASAGNPVRAAGG